jgi:hypothetical protein
MTDRQVTLEPPCRFCAAQGVEVDDYAACMHETPGDFAQRVRDRERDNIADWLVGWADGYSGDDEELETALVAFARDIREDVHREG